MKKIIFRIFSVLFIALFAALVYSIIFGVYNGTAEQMTMFFKMFLHPSVAIENPAGAASIGFQALIQFAIIYFFLYIGKKLWQKSTVENKNENLDEKINLKII